MGDMGADVILVEPPGGDPARGYPPFVEDEPGEDRSLYWWHYHTSKRGVVIDLDNEAGRERFRALVATADVLLEAEPRQRLSALGIDYDALKAIRPDLVHVAVTPYGRADPKSDLPFTDLTLMAAGGPPWRAAATTTIRCRRFAVRCRGFTSHPTSPSCPPSPRCCIAPYPAPASSSTSA